MEINAVSGNYNNTNFGAKVQFANSKFVNTMANIIDYAYAKDVLNRFEAYHPNATVFIKLVSMPNKYDSYLSAVNTQTNWELKQRLTPEDANKDFTNDKVYGGCKSLYSLLETLLNKNFMSHSDFWGYDNVFKPEYKPSEHSVFNA